MGAADAASGPIVSEALRAHLEFEPRARVVVVFEPPDPDLRDPESRRRRIHGMRSELLSGLDPTHLVVAHAHENVSAFSAVLDRAGLDALVADPRVVAVGLDPGGRGTLAQSGPLVGSTTAVGAGLDGTGVTVAVVDTGVDGSHPDLSGALVAEHCVCENEDGSGCCPDGSVEQDGPGAAEDENWHGTFVAGIVASGGEEAPLGMAPGVDLVAVRVMDASNGFQYASQVTAGLDWLLSGAVDVDVVNMSLSTHSDYAGLCDDAEAYIVAMAQAVEELRARGAVVFASSGNDGSTEALGAPGCISHVVTVGAVYDADVGAFDGAVCWDTETRADQVCCFSDSSDALDVLAPGAWITSSALGLTAFESWGTSFATPHAAGIAALVRQMDPSLDADALEALLSDTGKRVQDDRTGLEFPRLDVLAAVRTYPEDCADQLDNNHDGDADCADAQCAGATGAAGEPCEPDGEAACHDTFDNDGDGRSDCDDADCASAPGCESALEEAGGCACAVRAVGADLPAAALAPLWALLALFVRGKLVSR